MTVFHISLPSCPSPPRSPPHSEETNTLAVTSLPKSFFDLLILEVLRTHFESYGEINQWVPLPGFGRIIVVYQSDESAERAKLHSDPITLHATSDYPEVVLRVFRADRNPLVFESPEETYSRVPNANYLRPPAIEKNFLISPPGSPPVGWEPIQEHPPNSVPLAEDLISALKKLKVQEEQDERAQFEMLLDPMEAGVGVYVEDCDAVSCEVNEEDWVYGETMPARQKWRPMATAMPPMQTVSA